MFIVWYGNNKYDFLVQTDNVDEICAKAIERGFAIKEIIREV